MLQTLMIAFREGLEALLVVALASLYLRRTGRTALLGALHTGVGAALALSATLGIILAHVGALSPAWEGSMAVVAAAMVIAGTLHMLRMGRHMKQTIDRQLGNAFSGESRRTWWAIFAFALFMVGREGVETATMIASLALSSSLAYMALGGLAGFALAGFVAWLWVRHGHRVRLDRLFRATAVFMAAFAVQLLVVAFHEFTEAGLVPGLDNTWWHLATEDLAEGLAGQAISIATVTLPSLWLLVTFWLDRRQQPGTPLATSPRSPAPAGDA